MRNFEQICNDWGIQIRDGQRRPLPFADVMKEIYYRFSMGELQKFMNEVMAQELNCGERIFDYD